MKETKKVKTKDKIVLCAIQLFNENGVQSITSRHIAAELGISHGNLDYHYKTKEDLILAIYKRMRKEMSESYLLRDEYASPMEHFHRLLIHTEEFQNKYRFFNLDVLEISRSYPKISKLLKKTLEIRKTQMQSFFNEFITEGYMQLHKGDKLTRLQHTIRIVITFWLSKQEVLTSSKFDEKGEMVLHIWDVMLPYLTEKGHKEQQRLIGEFSDL
ncbi:TetR/AcrR family transcriptional regulator [Cellulophaga sp. F20128]|uniref:TetR/AcrR family transcriptional regulator n=1 Tax=Cellulophaga sp. F20128 TaxID=2926413 RepID=UPI001FF6A401|nr:TetR/AcrR family transcriptional regulator [Cellulophaga sp. F20128]MCK0157165.1 TetR/AcrR family transcriptional regulator [Cellulophaga sp. F20128]